MKSRHHAVSFLLRIWKVNGHDSAVRVSLQDPSSREVLCFAGIRDLCVYLEKMAHDLEQPPASGRMISG